jgi:hypothetical protein
MDALMIFVGRDSWSRPVYIYNGRYYVDVDPRPDRPPQLCTKQFNAFDGEPNIPISDALSVTFSPKRDTWP